MAVAEPRFFGSVWIRLDDASGLLHGFVYFSFYTKSLHSLLCVTYCITSLCQSQCCILVLTRICQVSGHASNFTYAELIGILNVQLVSVVSDISFVLVPVIPVYPQRPGEQCVIFFVL